MRKVPADQRGDLKVGQEYVLSGRGEKAPLMPHFEFGDAPIAEAVHNVGRFRVLERRMKRHTPWFRVAAGQREGWINAIALVGKDLRTYP